MISIIIPVLASEKETRSLIASLQTNVKQELEIIVVVQNDNMHFEGVKNIKVGENIGCGPAWNLGAKEATGEYFSFLHNDMLLTSDAYTPALEMFEKDAQLELASQFSSIHVPVPVFQEEDKEKLGSNSLSFDKHKSGTPSKPGRLGLVCPSIYSPKGSFDFIWVTQHGNTLPYKSMSRTKTALTLTKAQVALPFLVSREAYEAVKGFDERFKPLGWEFIDFNTKLRKAGFRRVVRRDLTLWHLGSLDASKSGLAILELLSQMRLKFREKWGSFLP